MAKEKSRLKFADLVAQLAAVDPIAALDLTELAQFIGRAGDVAARGAAVAAEAPKSVAVVPVYGPLTQRGSWYGTSMDLMRARIGALAADASIGSIVLDIDSPGGTVAGTAEAAAAVRAAAAQKPVIAVANTLAASAAYWIGSQASEFVIAPSGDVGSIGVMAMHQDISGWLEQNGIKMTMIRSSQSPLKNEANPFSPLGDDAAAFLQSRVDESGDQFVKAVAAGRRVSQTKVREDFGQGRVFGAQAAVARGMADRIATLDDVVAGLAKKAGAAPRRRSALAFD